MVHFHHDIDLFSGATVLAVSVVIKSSVVWMRA
jgi:hypothetical protein